jgi:hypothetical protein
VIIGFRMSEVALRKGDSRARIAQLFKMGFHEFQPRQQARAVGDLHIKTGARIELKKQWSLARVEHKISALIAEPRELPTARAQQKKFVPVGYF